MGTPLIFHNLTNWMGSGMGSCLELLGLCLLIGKPRAANQASTN